MATIVATPVAEVVSWKRRCSVCKKLMKIKGRPDKVRCPYCKQKQSLTTSFPVWLTLALVGFAVVILGIATLVVITRGNVAAALEKLVDNPVNRRTVDDAFFIGKWTDGQTCTYEFKPGNVAVVTKDGKQEVLYKYSWRYPVGLDFDRESNSGMSSGFSLSVTRISRNSIEIIIPDLFRSKNVVLHRTD